MWFDNQVINQVEADINRKIAQDRLKYNLRETSKTEDVQPQRRRFSLVAAFTRLFQRRESVQTPAPETHTQRRTV